MTAQLRWRPVHGGEDLPDPLRFALNKRGTSYPMRMTGRDFDYVCGLRDAGTQGAAELLELIDRFGEVELYLEF